MSTLSKKELEKQLKSTNNNSLIITPILDHKVQINQIGVDLRLGNQFIVFKLENIDSFDIKNLRLDKEQIRRIQKEIVIPFGHPFILHPRSLVLGTTFEYVSMPSTIEGSIEGRSSWARIGLVIATATSIDPGFKGCITLELANVSNIPLKLYPGSRIAKLICRKITSPCDYDESKKYKCPIGPEFSQVHLDEDNDFFMNYLKY